MAQSIVLHFFSFIAMKESAIIGVSILTVTFAYHLSWFGHCSLSASKEPKAFEGDMVLTNKQKELIKEAIKTGNNIESLESEKFAATTAVFPKWTNGVVPYILSPSLSMLYYMV